MLQLASAQALTVTVGTWHVSAVKGCSIWKWCKAGKVLLPHFGPFSLFSGQPLLFVTQLHGLAGVYALQVMVCCTRPCQPSVM